MKKNKKPNPQQVQKVITSPTVYAFDLNDIPTEKYLATLKVLFADPAFTEAVGQRNRLVKAAAQLRTGSDMTNLIRTIEKKDRALADTLFAAIVQTNVRSAVANDHFTFKQIVRYFIDYSDDDVRQNIDRLFRSLDKLTFLADMLESVTVDIRLYMQRIFADDFRFEQFDAVAQVLTQLKGYFGQIRNFDNAKQRTADLYMDYADSINDYLEKRLNAYNKKRDKIATQFCHIPKDQFIDSLNAFFGNEGRQIGTEVLVDTPRGGFHIDTARLLPLLNVEQTLRLNKIAKPLPAKVDESTKMKYDLKVSDAIYDYALSRNHA